MSASYKTRKFPGLRHNSSSQTPAHPTPQKNIGIFNITKLADENHLGKGKQKHFVVGPRRCFAALQAGVVRADMFPARCRPGPSALPCASTDPGQELLVISD